MIENYYKLFQIAPNSSNAEIKKAFRKLAFKFHPDKSKEANASERFHEIRTAYSILINEYSRKIYDQVLKSQESSDEFESVYETVSEQAKSKTSKSNWTVLQQHFSAAPRSFIMFLGGLALIYTLCTQYYKESTTSWAKTEAFFISKAIQERSKDGNKDFNVLRLYGYVVNDNHYHMTTEYTAQNLKYAEQLKSEPRISIYYDTSNPSNNIQDLDRLISKGEFFMLLIGILVWMRIFYWLARVSYKHYYE